VAYRNSWLKSYENRLKDYDDTVIKLLKRIEDIKKEKEELSKLMMQEPETQEEMFCKKYIEFGRLKDLYMWLNDNGYRVESGKGTFRKYGTNDVSQYIREQGKNKSNRFGEEALKLFRINTQDNF
jgi:hypothetical protein